MKHLVTSLLVGVLLLPGHPAIALHAQPSCELVLGFADFAAGSGDLVGDCVEDQRTLTEVKRVAVPGFGAVDLPPGTAVQTTTHGLLMWSEPLGSVQFLDKNGVWRYGESGLALTRWEATGILSAAPAAPPIPAATPVSEVTAARVSNGAPDPALLSRCVTLAADLAEELNQDLPPNSRSGGKVFEAFNGLCRKAVTEHGARGYSCFDTAWHRAIRQNRLMPPGSSAAARAAEAEYNLCVSEG